MIDRQKLKQAYKDLAVSFGILKITCNPTGQIFLYALTDIDQGKNSLFARLNGNMYRGSRNRILQDAWNVYGKDAFQIEVLDQLEKKETTDVQTELAALLLLWQQELPEAILVAS
ncbi:MAG: GIY-YIG nuclease family protein [Christensenellaceae bacterium]|jgi:hypothetical protein